MRFITLAAFAIDPFLRYLRRRLLLPTLLSPMMRSFKDVNTGSTSMTVLFEVKLVAGQADLNSDATVAPLNK